MRVMVLGAGGMLGRDLVATAPSDATLFAYTHAALDITDHAAVEHALSDARPEVIVNASAFTAVDRAESERDLASRVNAVAVGALAATAARAGVRVVHFSTDFVFDGTGHPPYQEDALVHPVNVYGESKLDGERRLAAAKGDWLLIRTQWLFGFGGHSFPRTMAQRAVAGMPTRVVNDQRGRPSATWDVAAVTWRLVQAGAAGIIHVANDGEATWYDVARSVFLHYGAEGALTMCTTADYPTPANRPVDSRLATVRLQQEFGMRLPAWKSALQRFLGELRLDR